LRTSRRYITATVPATIPKGTLMKKTQRPHHIRSRFRPRATDGAPPGDWLQAADGLGGVVP